MNCAFGTEEAFKDPTKKTESSCFKGAKKSQGDTVSRGAISNSESKFWVTSINGNFFGLISFLLLLGSSIHACVGGGGLGGGGPPQEFEFPANTAAGPEAEIALTEEVDLGEGAEGRPKGYKERKKRKKWNM